MNSDDFEKRLERQTIRAIPGEWRGEILEAAKNYSASPRRGFLSTLNNQLSTLLWPCPQAWAGLAAVWLVIFAVNFSTHETSPTVAQKTSPRSPQTLIALQQQEWILANQSGSRETPATERPKQVRPRPRSERREEFLTA